MGRKFGTRRALNSGQTPRPPTVYAGGGLTTTTLEVYWFNTSKIIPTKYRIEYSKTQFSDYKVAGYVNYTTATMSYQITGLDPSTQYFIRVVAIYQFTESYTPYVFSAYTLHPDVSAWREEVITLDGGDFMGLDSLWALNASVIDGLENNGYWSLVDRLWVYNANSFNACRVCVKTLSTWTDTYNIEVFGNLGFGFAFPDGVYLDTGFVPSTDSSGSSTDFGMGIYSRGDYLGTGIGDYGYLGASISPTSSPQVYNTVTFTDSYLRGTAFSKATIAETNSFQKTGIKAVTTDGSDVIVWDEGGTFGGSIAYTASSLPNKSIYVGAIHTGGGSVDKKNLEAFIFAGTFIGYQMSSGMLSKLDTLFSDYIAVQGI